MDLSLIYEYINIINKFFIAKFTVFNLIFLIIIIGENFSVIKMSKDSSGWILIRGPQVAHPWSI